MTDREWLEGFARRLDARPPTDEERELILALAAVAAHSSERTAAPSACWMAATSDRPLAEVIEIARRVSPAAPA